MGGGHGIYRARRGGRRQRVGYDARASGRCGPRGRADARSRRHLAHRSNASAFSRDGGGARHWSPGNGPDGDAPARCRGLRRQTIQSRGSHSGDQARHAGTPPAAGGTSLTSAAALRCRARRNRRVDGLSRGSDGVLRDRVDEEKGRPTRGRPFRFLPSGGWSYAPGVAPAPFLMPSVTIPTFSTPAPLAASMTLMMSPYRSVPSPLMNIVLSLRSSKLVRSRSSSLGSWTSW